MNLPTLLLAKSLAGTGLVTASVLGLNAGAGAAAATAPTSTAAPTSTGAQACRPHGLHVRHAPEALRKDLLAAREKLRDSDATGSAKRAERRAAREHIRAGILDGTYGAKLQQRAERRKAARERHRAALPAQLRSDLDALRRMQPGKDRRKAAAKVRTGRLDGTYGSMIQQHAQKQEQREQACQDQRAQKQTQKAQKADG